jgi:DNA-binding response OmpR family regulator
MKVLLVEDDAITRRMLGKVLETEGFETLAFETAEAAWETFDRESVPW